MSSAKNAIRKNYIDRSIQRLYGILEGVSADYILRDEEVLNLKNWLEINEYISKYEPFNELNKRIAEALEDGILDTDEKEELLEWCQEYCEGDCIAANATTLAVRRLHGVLHGLIIDNILSDEEIYSLHDWFEDYHMFRSVWPFNDLYVIVSGILRDNIIDEDERAFLKHICSEFAEKPIDKAILHDEFYEDIGRSGSKIFQPIQYIAEKDPEIDFKGKTFCFTGPAKTAKRDVLAEIVREMGGGFINRIVDHLDYLIIGSYSSPAWVYSTYGRKIEKAIDMQKKNMHVKIIMEDDFISQVPENIVGECLEKYS